MAGNNPSIRPRRFDEVVGQEHVKEILLAALSQGRVGHAYLFSGPRGVGKTTTARLLAMAVNCDAQEGSRPCGACASCSMVQRGEHPDVIELDAASNNSVEDIRDLREKVRLASLRGGRRVWVLDEAHMLSRAAANALLKTLEEPPPGLVFVLATTEPEKLPPTVLSRCQHFRFRRLSEEQIGSKLARLVGEAGLEADADALALVAKAADGAMRDAESLLQRLLLEGGRITRERAEAALGLPASERLGVLAGALLAGELDTLLLEAGALYRDGFAPRTVAEQLARSMRDMLMQTLTGEVANTAKATPARLIRAIDALDAADERFVRHHDLYTLEVALLRASEVGGSAPGQRDALTNTQPAAASAPARVPAPERAAPERAAPQRAAVPASAPEAEDSAATVTAADRTPSNPRSPAPNDAPAAPAPAFDPASASRAGARATAKPAAATPERFSWHQVMALASTQLKAFLRPAVASVEGDTLTLQFDEQHRFHHGQLRNRQAELRALLDGAGASAIAVEIVGPAGRDRIAAGTQAGILPSDGVEPPTLGAPKKS
jgi:DNA polymerase-3 subunit gamma/tau